MGAADQTFRELSAYRGLNPRQARLLDLRALYEGTQYSDLKAWSPNTQVVNGRETFIPSARREPSVQLGLPATKVDRLVAKLVGQGKRPNVTTGNDDLDEALADRKQLKLGSNLALPAKDLLVQGAGAFGFHQVDELGWEFVYLEPEWCEVVFVSQVRSGRARQLAEELAKVDGLTIPSDEMGFHLPEPKAPASSMDVAFVRYQYRFDEEQAEREGGPATKGVAKWRRRDYLPDAIVRYEDSNVNPGRAAPVQWQAMPPSPHNWGVVPLVWIRPQGTRPGDTEGASLFTPSFQKLSRAADYAASRQDDNIAVNCAPPVKTIDVESKAVTESVEFETSAASQKLAGGAEAVHRFESTGDHPEVSLLEVAGTAASAAQEHIESLNGHIDRVSGVVDFDQAKNAGVMSGTAIERATEPTVDKVLAYREPLQEGLELFCEKLLVAAGVVGEPKVTWPRVVAVTAEDVQAWGQALSTAAGGPVVSTETAAAKMAQVLELEDPEAEYKRLQAEQEAMLARLPGLEDDDDQDDDDDEA